MKNFLRYEDEGWKREENGELRKAARAEGIVRNGPDAAGLIMRQNTRLAECDKVFITLHTLHHDCTPLLEPEAESEGKIICFDGGKMYRLRKEAW